MTRSRAAWLGWLVAGSLLVGCGPKVDCEKLGARMKDCAEDLMFTLNPGAKERLKKATDPDIKKENAKLLAKDIERNRKTLKEQVADKCKAHEGRASDAKVIQKCLDEGAKECSKFASCFAGYLKNKSK